MGTTCQGCSTLEKRCWLCQNSSNSRITVFPAMSSVVIIGGGFAGCKVAKLLSGDSNLRVTMIDPKDFFEVAWVNPRALVSPDWAQRSIIPYSTFLPGIQHVKDAVATLEANKVVTKSGNTIEFNFCVVAVGSSYAGFMKAAATTTAASQRVSEIHAHSEQLRSASQVLVVGGGPSGVELAFEILDVYPTKKVLHVIFQYNHMRSNSNRIAGDNRALARPSPSRFDCRCQCVCPQAPC